MPASWVREAISFPIHVHSRTPQGLSLWKGISLEVSYGLSPQGRTLTGWRPPGNTFWTPELLEGLHNLIGDDTFLASQILGPSRACPLPPPLLVWDDARSLRALRVSSLFARSSCSRWHTNLDVVVAVYGVGIQDPIWGVVLTFAAVHERLDNVLAGH